MSKFTIQRIEPHKKRKKGTACYAFVYKQYDMWQKTRRQSALTPEACQSRCYSLHSIRRHWRTGSTSHQNIDSVKYQDCWKLNDVHGDTWRQLICCVIYIIKVETIKTLFHQDQAHHIPHGGPTCQVKGLTKEDVDPRN